MQRKFFDVLVSGAGLLLVVILLVAGVLLLWGANFTDSNVRSQLLKQDIYFPTMKQFEQAKPDSEVTPSMRPYLEQYAGQQLVTGAEAEAYADHFIAVHLSEMPYGGVYAKVSAAERSNPTAALAAEVQTTFQGTTLRGLLLEAYAFSEFGTIATFAAVASFAGAVILAILVGFGFWHARRTPEDVEVAVYSTEEEAEDFPI